MLKGKRILLIVGGGIAAFKSLELIRAIRKAGGEVTPVLTRAAQEFVTPLSASALAAEKVYTDLFDLTDEAEMGHIELSRSADLIVVAPATADLMAKMAGGHADDLASTVLMATDTPVLIAPAMNVRMWLHPANQRNVGMLEADGIHRIGPDEGDMACGEYGPGRMAEPQAIFEAIVTHLGQGPLSGKHVIVTPGAKQASLAALNLSDGKTAWQAPGAASLSAPQSVCWTSATSTGGMTPPRALRAMNPRKASSCRSSSVTRPPALRTTIASPISSPKKWVGSTRPSMHVTMIAGIRGRAPSSAWLN